MTAITPLQSIHKKGIFGDHHKKNESDLIQISEAKHLKIIQVVQYKRSKIQLSTIEIDDLKLPIENSKVTSNKKTRILWNAPKTWLIISNKENIFETIEKKCSSENFALTDISHSRAIIKIKGRQSKEILKKGSPINFDKFEKNNCAGTIFHGINILVDSIDSDFETYHLLTLRSFGESLYHHITDSALEFGYVGV